MAIPQTLDNATRATHEAFYTWLGGLVIDYGSVAGVPRPSEPILRVFASPDWAFARVVDLLVSRGWIAGGSDAEMRENAGDFATLPLPIATIEASPGEVDPGFEGAPKSIRRYYDSQTGEAVSLPWPRHDRMEFAVTFWSRYRSTDAYIAEWVHSELGKPGAAPREAYIPVSHPNPWGTLNQSVLLVGAQDLSDLEGGEQRYIRTTYTFSVRHLTILNETARAKPIEAPEVEYWHDPGSPSILLPPTLEERQVVGGQDFTPNLFVWPGSGRQTLLDWTISGAIPPGVDAPVEPVGFQPDPDRPRRSFRLALNPADPSYRVMLIEWFSRLDLDDAAFGLSASPIGLILAEMSYTTSGGDLFLDLYERADTSVAATLTQTVRLPRSDGAWRAFSRILIVGANLFSLWLRGDSGAVSGVVSGFGVRSYKRGRTLLGDAGGSLVWVGLRGRPHIFVATAPVGGADGTATWINDRPGGSPGVSVARNFGPTKGRGAAVFGVPVADAAAYSVSGADAPGVVFALETALPYPDDASVQSDD